VKEWGSDVNKHFTEHGNVGDDELKEDDDNHKDSINK
jgi:hypothetical protein